MEDKRQKKSRAHKLVIISTGVVVGMIPLLWLATDSLWIQAAVGAVVFAILAAINARFDREPGK